MVAAHSDYHNEDHEGWGAGRADVLSEEIRAAHTAMVEAHAKLLRLTCEYDRERYWEADGAHSNGEWLAWFLDLRAATGRDWARTARRLQDLPALTDALAEGDLSYDQVRVVARFADSETDVTWVGRAQRHSPGELERIARRYRPVTSGESQDAHSGRWLHYHTDTTRRVLRGSFEVPEDDGATLVKGLERQVDLALTSARDDPDAEHVPYQARLADALVDLAAAHITADTDCDR
ncbi:MAG: DUF222 domain-containing protein, partial [Acidimicrobiia bacterium]|nr:DUF222 domain-containing protein [Acidimicrobiia bacterium]